MNKLNLNNLILVALANAEGEFLKKSKIKIFENENSERKYLGETIGRRLRSLAQKGLIQKRLNDEVEE